MNAFKNYNTIKRCYITVLQLLGVEVMKIAFLQIVLISLIFLGCGEIGFNEAVYAPGLTLQVLTPCMKLSV